MNSRIAFIAAPLLTFTYGVLRLLDGLDGERGPGVAWTAGHLAFMAAMVFFVVVFGHLRDLAGRARIATVTRAFATVGAALLFVQFGVDLVAGFLAVDHMDMSTIIRGARTMPGVQLAVYDVGPYLFYVGLLVMVAQLAVLRRIKVWAPLLVLFDMMMPLIDKDFIPLGAIVLLVSFVAISRPVRALA